MPKGRAASNMAMGLASLKSGIPGANEVPSMIAQGLGNMPVNRMPTIQNRPMPLNTVPSTVDRVPSFPSAPSTLAPPMIGGPPIQTPPTIIDDMNMPSTLKMPRRF